MTRVAQEVTELDKALNLTSDFGSAHVVESPVALRHGAATLFLATEIRHRNRSQATIGWTRPFRFQPQQLVLKNEVSLTAKVVKTTDKLCRNSRTLTHARTRTHTHTHEHAHHIHLQAKMNDVSSSNVCRFKLAQMANAFVVKRSSF